jgi:hypothetical protein
LRKAEKTMRSPMSQSSGEPTKGIPCRKPSQRIMGRNSGKARVCSSKGAAVLLSHVRAGARQLLCVVGRGAQSLPKEGHLAGVSDREAGSWGNRNPHREHGMLKKLSERPRIRGEVHRYRHNN